jgi:preprotein translocase subunit SecD
MKPYPLWKYLALIVATVLGVIYSLPNIYLPDPAVQVAGYSSRVKVDQAVLDKAEAALKAANIAVLRSELGTEGAMIRLTKSEDQHSAQEVLERALNEQSGKKAADYVVALNKASTTPKWLDDLGAKPLNLGLDLAGGVHFVLEVDTPKSINDRMVDIEEIIKKAAREARLFNVDIKRQGTDISLASKDEATQEALLKILRDSVQELERQTASGDTGFLIKAKLSDIAIKEIEERAITQNLTTLRNRVNELGVAEPIVQRQGRNRIIVELPGLQDPGRAKAIIGKTANLEFRLEANANSTGKEKFDFRNEREQELTGGASLERRPIITGEAVVGAQVGYDAETGQIKVDISLSSDGGEAMHRGTRNEVGRRMGVLFIEYRTSKITTTNEAGETVEKTLQIPERKIINLATIQSALGRNFQITGLDGDGEARELALLLRSGALAAPMVFVEESIIGPSLGAENITKGVNSAIWGFLAVAFFMVVVFKVFGITANIALALNLLLLLSILAMFGATLTLPGIGGIVLTMGMAVDANVLIFSRIREELRWGKTPHQAIEAGFDRAFLTIFDANITTLLVALILFAIGTGPVKGFAATLSIGILTSMFTAIVGSRAIIQLIYGQRRVSKLWI